MTKNLFQTVLIGIFIAALVFGTLLFSGVIGKNSGSKSGPTGTVTLWGTLPAGDIANVLSLFYAGKRYNVNYVEKRPETYRASLLEAFSSGSGPDMFLINNEDAISYENKISFIPIDYFKLRDFQNTFVSEAELFVRPTGYLAMPILIDPLVLYWNRALFDNAGIPNPPQTWQEVKNITPSLTKRDNTGRITQSGIAIGTFNNVSYPKDIFSALILQKNNPLSIRNNEGAIQPTFQLTPPNSNTSPAEDAINLLSSYIDPLSPNYSWNKGMQNDRSLFAQSALAMYIGHASDLFTVQNENPNLNFDVVTLPDFGDLNVTYGKIHGVAISKLSTNPSVAFTVLSDLASPEFQSQIAQAFSLPPVRRDLLGVTPSGSPYVSTFYSASLTSRGWYDPNPEITREAFRSMLEAVISNTLQPYQAILRASGDFSLSNIEL